jgi:hypothetical protein
MGRCLGEIDPKNGFTLESRMSTDDTAGELVRPVARASGGAGGVAVKKAVDTLAIVPTRDKISVLTRKVYNVMMHHAQVQGPDQTTYRARLRDVINLVDFNSNNTEVLKEYFRSMVTTKVEWQSPTRAEGTNWGVSGMIAHAELISQKTGEVMLEWSYAPKLQQAILDPQRYARISLNFVSQLRTHAALALYEICSRYVDNPGALTARNAWQWWRPVLTGAPEGMNETYNEWKYFKRDCIAKAVAEVNLITDLEVEPVEHKQGRAMVDLQFRVRKKVQQKLPLRALPAPVDLRDIGLAIELGVPQAKAEKLYEKYGSARFKAALEQLGARAARTNLDAIRSPEKFLAALLAAPPEIAVIPTADKAETKSRKVELLEGYRDQRRREAESLFNEMGESERKGVLKRFEASLVGKPTVASTFAKRGTASAMTRSMFLRFIAEDFFGSGWDAPSDTELLDHAISS